MDARVGGAAALPLFAAAPGLSARVPWLPLGVFPTPVERWSRLGAAIGCPELWVKRDDRTGGAGHGGNKVRKLEFLLARARAEGKGRVFVYGATGSNWVVAALSYARELGLARDVMLFASPTHAHAERNLAVTRALADTLVLRGSVAAVPWDVGRALWRGAATVLPMGGTDAVSTLGYLNAALELAGQVRRGECPEPEYVFVPLGTCGTAAGLAAGFHLAGLATRVIAVRITGGLVANAARTWLLAARALTEAARGGAAVPGPLAQTRLTVVGDQLGAGYALATPAGEEATRLAAETEGAALDPSYTAKTVAALIAAVRQGGLGGRRVLYWLTLNSAPLPGEPPAPGAAVSAR
ncbi:MAG: pyridoxal-phosphate dependent enzyme [Planctomycetes bacterium]|nr:pyridoxal-phosphate dependent enzyme [Planctomycetota bacterium]